MVLNGGIGLVLYLSDIELDSGALRKGMIEEFD